MLVKIPTVRGSVENTADGHATPEERGTGAGEERNVGFVQVIDWSRTSAREHAIMKQPHPPPRRNWLGVCLSLLVVIAAALGIAWQVNQLLPEAGAAADLPASPAPSR
jgi:hypothetical protein